MPITKINSLGVNLTSPLTFSAGTAALPSITFSGDTNTGVFAPAADTIAFTEGGAERVRITPSGYFKASYDGTYVAVASPIHEFVADQVNNTILNCTHESTTEPYGTTIDFTAASPNNGTNYFLRCSDTTNTKLNIFSNGTVTNRTGTYNSFSDLKLKQDIVDASSQWEDIKSLRVVNYRLKQEVAIDPNYPSFIGVIAQEVEKISPALVENNPDLGEIEITDEEGNITKQITKTGTVTKAVKYSILYMKAVKALQEAMERIEQLETKNTSLEARLTALESK